MKNVILITMDAVRPNNLSCYGYDKIKTEGIDSIAKEGILFRNVIASSCLTPTAHASILSGKNPDKTGVRDPFCKVQTRLISEILKENGYKTAGFVGINFLSKKHGFSKGFDYFDEPTEETGWDSKKYKKGNETMDTIWGNWWVPRMLDWVKKNSKNNFFIWCHYFKVHYHAEKQMLKDGLIKEGELEENGYYDAKIKYMDDNFFKPMIQLLKDLGIWDDTTIIITSDHGESFQYEYPQHRTLYESDLKIPLIIKDKNLETGRVIEYTVRSIDIVPTILNLLDISSTEKFDGVSLFPLWRYKQKFSYSEELFENRGQGSLQSVRTDGLKVIINRTKNIVEVYDLINDPNEEHNILDEMYDSYKIKTLTKKEEKTIKSVLQKLGYLECEIQSPSDALKFLDKKAKESSFIKNKEGFRNHAIFMSTIIQDTVGKTRINNPSVKIDEVEMMKAGILHDIGSCISNDSLHHSITGAKYLEEIGLSRISKIIKTHNFIKEIVGETGYKGINPSDLDIKTWNEALITHASMICGKNEIISFDEKLKRQRSKRNDFFRKISKKGEKRIREIYDDVEKLKSGNKEIINKYKVL